MEKHFLSLVFAMLLSHAASAGTVLWADSGPFIFWNGPWEGEYSAKAEFSWELFGITYDAYAYCQFYLREGIAYPSEWRLAARGTNALLMGEGDPVEYSTTFGTDKVYYYSELQTGATEAPLELSEYEPILLGFATVNDGDPAYGEYIYGWIRLIYDGENLNLDSSAVTIGTDVAGIYAGTGIIIPRQIPEPSVVALVVLGAAVFLLRRGNRSSEEERDLHIAKIQSGKSR